MTGRLLAHTLSLACCMLACSPVAAQLTGTLFTSPAQREYLDYLRQDFLASSRERGFDINDADIPDIPVTDAEAQEAQGPVAYTLGGIVTLRDGTQRIWLNGQALSEAELPREARLVRDNGALALRFTTATGSYLLRPGQTLELTAGTVMENYQRPVPVPPGTGMDAPAATEKAAASPTLPAEAAPARADTVEALAAPNDETASAAETASEIEATAGIEELQARLQALEQAQFGQDDDA